MLLFMTGLAGAIEAPKPGINAKLSKHQQAFDEPQVLRVSEHVYVAYAYTMCNVVMVVGDDGAIIFDTGFRFEQAQDALLLGREGGRLLPYTRGLWGKH